MTESLAFVNKIRKFSNYAIKIEWSCAINDSIKSGLTAGTFQEELCKIYLPSPDL